MTGDWAGDQLYLQYILVCISPPYIVKTKLFYYIYFHHPPFYYIVIHIYWSSFPPLLYYNQWGGWRAAFLTLHPTFILSILIRLFFPQLLFHFFFIINLFFSYLKKNVLAHALFKCVIKCTETEGFRDGSFPVGCNIGVVKKK